MTSTTEAPPSPPSTGSGDKIRPPWSRQRAQLWALALLALVLIPIGMWQTGMSPARLIQSVGDVRNLFDRMWPPSFREWNRYVGALVTTVWMVIAGTALALVFSIPLSVLAARNTTTGRLGYAVSRAIIVFTRSVPAIVFALVFVRAIGIGPVAGVMAIAVNSIGMVGKFYSDAIEEVDPGPIEAMRATGAGRLQVFVSAVLPQVLANWIALGLYRVDINVRSAVILGYVGAGGIGLELQRVQGQLAYSRVLAIVVLIFALIVLVEQISNVIRRALLGGADDGPKRNPWKLKERLRQASGAGAHVAVAAARDEEPTDTAEREAAPPPEPAQRKVQEPWTKLRKRKWTFGVLGLLLTLVSFLSLDISPRRYLESVGDVFALLALMVPPDFTTNLDRTIRELSETFWIAVAATGLGLILSVPFAVLGARNVTPNRIAYRFARLSMLVVRGIPELILAVLFVVAVGLGPFAGVLALTIGAVGLTGKLMADALESLPLQKVQEGLSSTGASWLQRTVTGVLPQAMPSMVGVGLYTFDVYIRAATILGIVGAGGIGNLLDSTISQRQFDRMAGVILLIFAIVYGVERFSGWLRKQLI
jgi:phosphonate transport system permease protein